MEATEAPDLKAVHVNGEAETISVGASDEALWAGLIMATLLYRRPLSAMGMGFSVDRLAKEAWDIVDLLKSEKVRRAKLAEYRGESVRMNR